MRFAAAFAPLLAVGASLLSEKSNVTVSVPATAPSSAADIALASTMSARHPSAVSLSTYMSARNGPLRNCKLR